MGLLLTRAKDLEQDSQITTLNDNVTTINNTMVNKNNNLADLADIAAARTNLDVYDKSSVDSSIKNAVDGIESGIHWTKACIDIVDDAPDLPAEGDRYLVSGSPTEGGAFDGHAWAIAEYDGSAWNFTETSDIVDGTSLVLTGPAENPTYRFNASTPEWVQVGQNISLATESADGLMSSEDKSRLDNLIGNYSFVQEPNLIDIDDDGNGNYTFTLTDTPLSGALVGKVIVFNSDGNVKAEFAKMTADSDNIVTMPSSYNYESGDKAYAEYIKVTPV
jgi:hypothetical protein